MELLINFYITFLPVILAGVLNMVIVKLPILKILKKPMDFNIVLKDGNRLFGENKTWKGCFSMIILSMMATFTWGMICNSNPSLQQNNLFYNFYENTIIYNIVIGFLLGLAYILFELPNSFIKRRTGIKERKHKKRNDRQTIRSNRSN